MTITKNAVALQAEAWGYHEDYSSNGATYTIAVGENDACTLDETALQIAKLYDPANFWHEVTVHLYRVGYNSNCRPCLQVYTYKGTPLCGMELVERKESRAV